MRDPFVVAFVVNLAQRFWRSIKPHPFDESNVLRYIRNLFRRR